MQFGSMVLSLELEWAPLNGIIQFMGFKQTQMSLNSILCIRNIFGYCNYSVIVWSKVIPATGIHCNYKNFVNVKLQDYLPFLKGWCFKPKYRTCSLNTGPYAKLFVVVALVNAMIKMNFRFNATFDRLAYNKKINNVKRQYYIDRLII
jgi:hypothetical protein